MAFRYLSALAVVGLAAAEQCSISGTTTISSAAQATALSTCQTFQGSIAIAKGTTGDITLDGISRLKGSLIANDAAQLTSISADSLTIIDSAFSLQDCPTLSSLTFPALTEVASINWVGLAGLSQLSFTSGVQLADSVIIENTMLGSLEGIDLQEVGVIELTNNPFLNSINMQLGNITRHLIISANGRQVDLSLPNLIWANNLYIQNASSIDLDSLSAVNGSLGFLSNFVDSISCPNLTTIGQSLAINANAQLTNVTMPQLKTITGGFAIQNNTAYGEVTGFPKVATIGGAINFRGIFTSIQLPALSSVRGGFSVLSSATKGPIQNQCTKFKSLCGSSSTIQGLCTCNTDIQGASTKPGSTTGSGTSPSGSAAATSSSAANAVLITGATGVLGVVAAMFGML